MSYRNLIFNCLILLLPALSGQAQPAYCGAPYSTFLSANILFPATLQPTLDGAPLPFGSYIIAIYQDGNQTGCAGYIQWNGFNALMVVNGADGTLPGYQANQPYRYLVQLPDSCLLDSIQVRYDITGPYTNPGFFQDGGLSKVATFHAFSRPWLTALAQDGLCGDSTARITAIGSGFGAPYKYAWSTGDSTASIQNLPSGRYTVTVTDAYNCSLTSTATVMNIPAMALQLETSLQPDGKGCQSTVSITGGTAPYQMGWSNGQTGPSATDLPGGAFSVTVRDANGCTAMKTDTCMTVSTSGIAGLETFILSPNPANGFIRILARFEAPQETRLSMLHPTGQIVSEHQYAGPEIKANIDLSALPSGVYVFRLETRNGMLHRLLLVQ